MSEAFTEYLKVIQEIGSDGTEHAYRTPFQNFLNAIKPEDVKFKVTHEPHREKDFGAPDFLITSKGLPIGYIETKKLDASLSEIRKTDQVERYLKVTPNLIITNYHDFLLIKNGIDVETVTLFALADVSKKHARLVSGAIEELERLFESFFTTPPIQIEKVDVLAEELAKRGKLLKEFILEEMQNENPGKYASWLSGLYEEFKKTLIAELTEEGFADVFTQTLIYGLLLAGIEKSEHLERVSAYANIPMSIQVIHELFDYFSKQNPPERFDWIYDEIIAVINATNFENISQQLLFSSSHQESDKYDPYYDFYEPFLKNIDALQKKEKGVYYTPIPVVSFIIRSLNSILKNSFHIQNGFGNQEVTTLDFACGTGTFLAEIFKYVINSLKETNNYGQIKNVISGHILKNFYGFEYLVAPYAIAHLKLTRLIEELADGYKFGNRERLQIYLTNTLNDTPHTANPLFQAISMEGEEANRIKKDEKILVVTGNPPYNVHSKNNSDWLDANMPIYKPRGEKNVQPLNDDYVKFIRFAHHKMEQIDRGVIGIITNNRFISGLIHRKMRAELLGTFDEIYILNLHGDSNIGETAPDGSSDDNVFDIKQGVCISFFIKMKFMQNDCKVFYHDLYGKQKEKFEYLRNNDIESVSWQELDYKAFDKEFSKTRWSNRFPYLKFLVPMENESVELTKMYGNYWGMKDIFDKFSSGIKTHRDHFVVDYEKSVVKNRFEYFINSTIAESSAKYELNSNRDWSIEEAHENCKNIDVEDTVKDYHFRPFDIRKILYTDILLDWPRCDLMSHFLEGKNIGIVFPRNISSTEEMNHFLATEIIDDIHLIGGQSYIAPLYLYENPEVPQLDASELVKHLNFKTDFIRYIRDKYSMKPSPEQIYGYIYAISYCPTYRKKYLDLFQIDYPRIPFIDDETLFFELSDLGWELAQHHLMKETYDLISNYPKSGTDQVNNLKKAEGDSPGTVRVWINKEQYFDNIPTDIWEFSIGGYQVLDTWLKYRKRTKHTLTNKEINTFHRIVSILEFTIKQMERIEEIAKDII